VIRITFRVALTGCLLAVPSIGTAQFVVYDPTNYAQAVTAYTQAVQEYQFWLRQAKRLPAAVLNRYRVPEIPWQLHQVDLLTDRLEPLDGVSTTVPTPLLPRLTAHHAAITNAEQLMKRGLDHAKAVRIGGGSMMRAIQALDDDVVGDGDAYHAETALLNKITGASVLGLRIAERSTQFLAQTVEQLILENMRKRDTEAQLMNAHVFQWNYGSRYGADLFSHTAKGLDSWRQP
jgi:hypothetical protein